MCPEKRYRKRFSSKILGNFIAKSPFLCWPYGRHHGQFMESPNLLWNKIVDIQGILTAGQLVLVTHGTLRRIFKTSAKMFLSSHRLAYRDANQQPHESAVSTREPDTDSSRR